ncbi:hypothetical protein ABS642_00915 [Microbacterium sp. A8/3-1]|uniref:Uncharacterized protein n=1 Tax=Microbacterium sp. A8/3-1 TaxID=3160749 RepID=A0AAU7VWN6_9MICO
MARERATINVDIWNDDDWRDCTDAAQSLYFKLLTHADLSYCGVADFRPGRLAAMTREQVADDVMIAAQELADKHFIVVDQDTEEVLVRSFLRWDGLLKQPRLAVSAAKAFGAVASNKIRAVIVHELLRYKRENPDLSAWEKPQMKTVLRQNSVSVRETVTQMEWAFAQSFGERYAQRYGHRSDQTSGTAQTGPTTSTATSTPTATSSIEDAADPAAGYPQGSRLRVVGNDMASMEVS